MPRDTKTSSLCVPAFSCRGPLDAPTSPNARVGSLLPLVLPLASGWSAPNRLADVFGNRNVTEATPTLWRRQHFHHRSFENLIIIGNKSIKPSHCFRTSQASLQGIQHIFKAIIQIVNANRPLFEIQNNGDR